MKFISRAIVKYKQERVPGAKSRLYYYKPRVYLKNVRAYDAMHDVHIRLKTPHCGLKKLKTGTTLDPPPPNNQEYGKSTSNSKDIKYNKYKMFTTSENLQ